MIMWLWMDEGDGCGLVCEWRSPSSSDYSGEYIRRILGHTVRVVNDTLHIPNLPKNDQSKCTYLKTRKIATATRLRLINTSLLP